MVRTPERSFVALPSPCPAPEDTSTVTSIRFAPFCTQQPAWGSSASWSPVCALSAACPLRPLDAWAVVLVFHLWMDIGAAARTGTCGHAWDQDCGVAWQACA